VARSCKLSDEDWADSFALKFFWSGARDARSLASLAEECRFRAVYFRGRWKDAGCGVSRQVARKCGIALAGRRRWPKRESAMASRSIR
jgi:hypothetical protein